jgi:hypothetical protein
MARQFCAFPLAYHPPIMFSATMIDDLVILFSTGMCLFILLRAIRLDRVLPWFGAAPRRPETWFEKDIRPREPDDVS